MESLVWQIWDGAKAGRYSVRRLLASNGLQGAYTRIPVSTSQQRKKSPLVHQDLGRTPAGIGCLRRTLNNDASGWIRPSLVAISRLGDLAGIQPIYWHLAAASLDLCTTPQNLAAHADFIYSKSSSADRDWPPRSATQPGVYVLCRLDEDALTGCHPRWLH